MASRRPTAEHAADSNPNPSLIGRPTPAYASRLAVPRYDQRLASSSASERETDIETMSHAPTNSQYPVEGSIYSYNSTRDISQFVREAYGRIFNTLNDSYLLPTDDAEWERLDKQHSALLIAMDGLYPCADIVEAILTLGDEPKRVLDIGCGTGSWAIEVASRFPHVAVKGVDLAPSPIDSSIFPPNLEMEIDDVNQGLQHFYDEYDIVRMCCVSTGLTNIDETMKELQMCLKPGGLLLVVDGDIEFRNEQMDKVKMKKVDGDEDVSSVSEEGSFFQRLVWEAHEASRLAGAVNSRTSEMIDLGLWDQELCDPETAVAGGVYLPIGPWAQGTDATANQALKYVGMLMRQGFISIHRSFHPILLKYGVSQELLDDWSTHIDEEIKNANPRMWVRFRFCYARRRAGQDLPAPSLPGLSTNASQNSTQSASKSSTTTTANLTPHGRIYPAFEAFHTREDALEARMNRRATNGVWPTAVVERAYLASLA